MPGYKRGMRFESFLLLDSGICCGFRFRSRIISYNKCI